MTAIYLNKAKFGFYLFCTAPLIGVAKKLDLIDMFLGTQYDVYFMIYIAIVIVTTVSIILIMPFVLCWQRNEINGL